MLPTTDENKLKLTLSILDDSIKKYEAYRTHIPDTLLKYGLVHKQLMFSPNK